MDLRSKPTSEICQKIREFKRKNKGKNFSRHKLCQLFLKKSLYLLKIGKYLSTSCSKNKFTNKFYVFTIKSTFGNVSESSDCRLRAALTAFVKHYTYITE